MDPEFFTYCWHTQDSRFLRGLFLYEKQGPEDTQWPERIIRSIATIPQRLELKDFVPNKINAANCIGGRIWVAEPLNDFQLRNPANGYLVLIKIIDPDNPTRVLFDIAIPRAYREHYGRAVRDSMTMQPEHAFAYLLVYPWMTNSLLCPKTIEQFVKDHPLRMEESF